MVCVLLLVALLIPWLLGAGPAGAAEPGGELYIKRGCLGCHGASGRGGVGPALAHTALPLDAFVKQVRQPRGIMPPFPSEAVSEPELHAIHEYLRAVPPPAPRLRLELVRRPLPRPHREDLLPVVVATPQPPPPPAPPRAPKLSKEHEVLRLLRTRGGARNAVILAEILGRPKALRRPR